MNSELYYLATYIQDVGNKLPSHFAQNLQNSIINYSDERFTAFMGTALPFHINGATRVCDLSSLSQEEASSANICWSNVSDIGAFLSSELHVRDVQL